MPQATVATENEFSDGVVSYRGPLVRDVLAHVGLDDLDEVRFTAANDYFVDIPTTDFRDYDAILAMEADGEKLSPAREGAALAHVSDLRPRRAARSRSTCAG